MTARFSSEIVIVQVEEKPQRIVSYHLRVYVIMA